ncbi:hypothetical protein M0812_24929 [Anaeramoeba flamelloides]|uniref:Uncharacterized protein n=1 Tax=Anaeramoeba flamelloides TaxID=1746091 RepID=A0AAV7YPJ8_9EUKA|nr:hypothetical protein M0812_24929 [Anaeramoeba flamelloides]
MNIIFMKMNMIKGQKKTKKKKTNINNDTRENNENKNEITLDNDNFNESNKYNNDIKEINNNNKNKLSNNFNLYKNINIETLKRDNDFLKEIQKFLSIMDLQVDNHKYQNIIKKISKKYGVLLQRGNPFLHLFNFKSTSFYHFTICWVHLLLEGLFKDGIANLKLLLNNNYLEILTKNINILLKFYSWINIPENPLNIKLNAMEVLDFSMILKIAIQITEYQNFITEIKKIEKNFEKKNENENKDNNKDNIYNNDNLIYKIYKSGNYHKLLNNFSTWKKYYLNKLNKKHKIKTILKWVDCFNNLISNLFLPSRNEQLDDKLKILSNKFRFIHFELNNHKNLKLSSLNVNSNINNRKKSNLYYLKRQTNIHYLRHLHVCIKKNGSMFTFYLALERFHQYFKLKSRNLKLKGQHLLFNLIEYELMRKIHEVGELDTKTHIQNRKYKIKIPHKYNEFLKKRT